MKHTSKIVAVMLAILMIACMLPMAAFASETPSTERVAIGSFTSGTITINASNADDSFAVYKVVDVNYNSGTNEVTYAFTSTAAAYNATLGASAPTVAQYQAWAHDSDELKNYLGGFAAYVKNPENSVTANYTGQATGSVCTITGVAIGQYLVLGTGSSTGAYVYQLMTATFAPDSDLKVNTGVTLGSKASQPTVTKTAEDTQVATGDTVTFTIEFAIPTYPAGATNRTFEVTDVLPAEIDYVATTSVKVDTTDLADTAFTFVKDGKNLSWTITDFDAIAAYAKLVIVYTAKVNSDITDVAGATNTAELTYSNNPYGTGTYDISSTETVYSYGIAVTKVDKDTQETIKGVEFELYKDSVTGTKIGTYTTDDNGVINIKGLDVGTYYLKETKAASGYVLPAAAIEVTITDTDKDGKIDVADGEGTTNIVAVKIENTKGDYNLPQTGGIGTWVFTIIGVCLMAGAVALLVAYKKRSDKTN